MNTSDIIVCTLEIICSVTYEVEWVTSHSCHSGQWWLTRGAVWTHFHSFELKIANAHGAPGLPIGSSHAGRCVPALHSKEYFFDSLLSPPYHPLFSLLCSICILWNDILFTTSSTRLNTKLDKCIKRQRAWTVLVFFAFWSCVNFQNRSQRLSKALESQFQWTVRNRHTYIYIREDVTSDLVRKTDRWGQVQQ